MEWNRLHELKLRLEESDLQKELSAVGMSIEASRLLRWIDLYGDRLGITQAPSAKADHRLIAISAWHEGWESLSLEGRHALRKLTDEGLKAFITDALSLFDKQLAIETEIERQRRIKQEERSQEAPTAEVSDSD